MPEKELHKRIEDLESENRLLRHENKSLREVLGYSLEEIVPNLTVNEAIDTDGKMQAIALTEPDELSEIEPEKSNFEPVDLFENEIAITESNVNKYSSPQEKIELFMSLFRGRSDVYAKRYYSKQHGEGYYMPACKNEWVGGVCDKPRVKCKNCLKRELSPLTNEVIDSHLRNKDENGNGIVGVYPLLPDENCLFLAIDFDEANWQKDAATFRLVCKKLAIPVAVERSRSGNGAHVWMFFDAPVPALSARKLGNILLTKAMSFRHEIRFSSYDRMFPNQDFMPKGGFGNLIALPLQGGARKNGNSEFVDDNFISYSDQWAYLASIRKLTSERIKKLLSGLGAAYGFGELSDTDTEDTPKPWERKKQEVKLGSRDFPDQLTIVEANRLYIPKRDISQRALNKIKRLAAFSNPQFYKTQKMRLSTFGIPQIIYSLDETADYMGIPRGCRSSLISLLNDAVVKYEFEDKRNNGKEIRVGFKGALFEEQQLAAEALLQHENGVLAVPTAFGKTVIGASLISQRKCNTLILVHLQTLFDQWKKSLEQFPDIITKIYTAIVDDEFRNRQIVADVLEAVSNDRTPIILTHRKEHVLRLSELLNHSNFCSFKFFHQFY